ncbi:TIGR03084 family metal-binding protein [Kitasatospora sp. NPDC052896]|uniref:TIGR03084 family metal-binding protein n=1 Tax=Kitasatospora sp. NPDC052896 TaxID=3364061 RepID=UPI0037C54638
MQTPSSAVDVPDRAGLLADLIAEGDELDGLVAELDSSGWATPTPAPGWTIAHQIAHLAWTDTWSLRAVRDPAGFPAAARASFTGAEPGSGDGIELGGAVDLGAEAGARRPHPELLAGWRAGRAELARALARTAPDTRLPWMGPPMKPASMATARIMETWAHGQDVADALGVVRSPTARLRHIAHLGVRTRGFAFTVHGLAAPAEPVRVELTGPAGESWSWGPAGAADRITGPALDFCLLVTRRRHHADLAVTPEGPVATAWLPIAQAFAGPPGAGRARRGQRPSGLDPLAPRVR